MIQAVRLPDPKSASQFQRRDATLRCHVGERASLAIAGLFVS